MILEDGERKNDQREPVWAAGDCDQTGLWGRGGSFPLERCVYLCIHPVSRGDTCKSGDWNPSHTQTAPPNLAPHDWVNIT